MLPEDYILLLFKTAWDSGSPSYNGGNVIDVAWPTILYSPSPASPWARITVQHVTSNQASLGQPPSRKFTRTGIVTVQVFCPHGAGDSTYATALARIARDAYEGRETQGIWFRKATITDVGRSGAWYQVNASAIFEYDEHK